MPLQVIDPGGAHGGLEQYPMTDAVRAMADLGAFRSPAVQVALQTLCRLREADLKDTRDERRSAESAVQAISRDYHSEHTQRMVLQERLRCGISTRKLRNVLITLGGVLLGVGLQPLVNAFSMTYCIFAVVGLVMLAIGWFYPADPGREDKE